MISFQPESVGQPPGSVYTRGFRVADTDDAEEVADIISLFACAPAAFKEGYRKKANFLYADWLALDFDDGFELDQACRSFIDMIHIIGTTRSHRKEKNGRVCDRFRVLIKASERVTDLAVYEATLKRLGRRYPVDNSALEGARHFFPCSDIVQVMTDGYTEEIAPATAQHKRINAAKIKAGIPPAFVRRALQQVIPNGERNTTCYRIGKDLYPYGISVDDVVASIVDSPTYQGHASTDLLQEITTAVSNGFKAALAEESVSRGTERE